MTLMLLVSCAQELAVEHSQGGCVEYDFDDPADSEVHWEWADPIAKIWRTNVALEQSQLEFDPTFKTDGNLVSIYEAWGGEPLEAPFCYQPEIHVEGMTRKLEIRWYSHDDETVPFATLEIEPRE